MIPTHENQRIMPRTTSAKKALRQSVTRRARNMKRKAIIKSSVKGFRKLVAEGKLDEAKASLPRVMKAVDKVAKSGLIKKGKASRIKSRLAKNLKKTAK
jgi:small subunit ribosomal protein S20